jgi:hypothetical protein
MSSLSHLSANEIHSCLRYIAELRVQGKEWEEISQDMGRPVNEIRRFVYQNEEVFRVFLKMAHQDQKQLCYSVAYEVLRHQTASKNEKISHSSACMLLRMKLSEDRLKLKKLQEKMRAQAKENKKPTPPTPPSPVPNPPNPEEKIKTSVPKEETSPSKFDSIKKVETPVTVAASEQGVRV